MDAVKFLKEKARMTNECNILCDDCPVHAYCNHSEGKNAERMVAIVEKWAEEHPVKTRQSEFLKMFPNVPKPFGYADICPKDLGENKGVTCNGECSRCKKEYWLAEVE